MNRVKLIECPRDAMQGWTKPISTKDKVRYIQSLLAVGFDTIDFGSFVSHKAIPQMVDTKDVIKQLDLSASSSKLLAIVANKRGAEDASAYEQISFLGYPFSVSEVFQQKNTNSSIEDSLKTVEELQEICLRMNKKLVVYLSMAFGNPYGELFNEGIVFHWSHVMQQMGIQTISLADTVGLATPEQVGSITKHVLESLNDVEVGVHLHSSLKHQNEKINAAYTAGARRFDSALKGIGGCPMANDELVGNINTEEMIGYMQQKTIITGIDQQALKNSLSIANEIFTA